MKELLIYLYNSTHPHSTDIKFDDQFGNEKEVQYLVSKLVQAGVVSIIDTYYSEIQVKVEPTINILAQDFNFDLDKYIKSQQKHSYVKVDGNAIIGDNNKNINQSGRDLSVFPHIQPDTSPIQNIDTPKPTEVNMSKAQFIFWLFSVFLTGITIGLTIGFNIFKK